MMGLQSNDCVISFNVKYDIYFSKNLNIFYKCFDIHDLSEGLAVFLLFFVEV